MSVTTYLSEIHRKMQLEKLLLLYRGEFNQEVTKGILSMAERNMEASGEASSVRRKVFNIMVEALQNIIKHGGNDHLYDADEQNALFGIGQTKGDYLIITGNRVENEYIDILKSKIDQVNNLDKDGLKVLYKDIIKNGSLSAKGGAGLGLIDMARKSGQKLKYAFKQIDERFSFYTLQISISQLP